MPRYRWYVVGMLWWICFFNYADRQAIFSVFPLLEKEFGLTLQQLGWLGSSFGIIYGLCAPLAGRIVDRVNRKNAILGGLHTWSFIAITTAFSRGFGQLLFFRAAEGLGETFYMPASMSLVSDYHGTQTRSRALGLHQTSVYMGTIAGGYFAGLIGQTYGWRWSFVVFGALGVALGVVLHRFLIEPQRGAAEHARGTSTLVGAGHARPSLFRTPTVLILLAAFLCANFAAVVVLTWMPKFLYDKFHLSLAAAGLLATIFIQLASMVGSPAGGWIADRLRARRPDGRLMVQAAGLLCGAPFVVLCGLTRSIAWLIAALIAWGFCKGLYDANIFAALFDVVPPDSRGTATGVMNMVGWLGGGGAAPIVTGYIAQHYSLGIAISVTSAAYLAGGALLLAGIVFFIKRDVIRVEAALERPAIP
jgi:MFS family permease